MKLSWKWLSDVVDLSKVDGPRGLAELLTARGLEVESMHRLDAGFEKVITVKILKRDKHPKADRLSVCLVSAGSGDPLEIVCGAQNMKAGDTVALAQIGAELPNGLKIERSKIREVVSNGMLCSEQELGLKDSSEGILILPEGTSLGEPLAKILKRDDTVFELKLTPNRGDCLSVMGVAREVSSATGGKIKTLETEKLVFGAGGMMKTALEANDKAPQFWGAVIEGVKIAPSPDWVRERLESVGLRSINNVVDATNLVMLELGQPVHAYDLAKLKGPSLTIKPALKGSKLPLLDGSEITLEGFELIVADGEKPVGLGGVMGGGNSEVSEKTTKLFLEAAEFDPVLVRKAARKHVKHTDAAHRFERGVDPSGHERALSRLAWLVLKLAGGKVVSATRALRPEREKIAERKVTFAVSYIPGFLGAEISKSEIVSSLSGLGCKVTEKGANVEAVLEVVPPSYRLDLNLREDFAEEVARIVGYDRIPSTIPHLSESPTAVRTSPQLKEYARIEFAKDTLAQLGLSETLQYSFLSKKWLAEFGLQSTVNVLNPLSEEQEAMVPSLVPGLILQARENLNRHFGSETVPLRLFQIRPTFHAIQQSDDAMAQAKSEMETTVREIWKLSFLMSGNRTESTLKSESPEIDFYDVKAVVEGFLERMGTRGARMRAVTESALFHPGQSMEIAVGKDRVGAFGRLHPLLERRLKLRQKFWIAEFDWQPIANLSREVFEAPTFKAWSTQPRIERDFALLVKSEVESERIVQVAMKAGKPLAQVVKVFDIYKGSQVAQGMTSVAVRVIFGDDKRSLQESEADQASSQILNAWKKELEAVLRG